MKKILAYLCLWILLTACSSNYKTIVNGISERDANEIIVLLSSKGIDANKVQSAQTSSPVLNQPILYDIQVPLDQSMVAMDILDQAGLPRPKSSTLLQLFSSSSLVPNAQQEKIKYQAGLAQQIANTIRSIDGVLDASVIISFPPDNPFEAQAPTQPITASVFVKHNGILDDPNSHLIQKIKQLVSASVSGLTYDNVTVIPERADLSESNPSEMTDLNEPTLVDVWSITVAKNSVNRFHAIFFGLILFSLFALLALLWVLWKIFPILKDRRFGHLFSFKPLEIPEEKTKTDEKKGNQGNETKLK